MWPARLLCVTMAACVAFFAVDTWHWPMVGDAVSLHYLVLLMDHGMTPYRQIVDAQMPGAYLVDWLAVHTFGGGARGLRLYDFALLLAAALAMLAIAWPATGAAGANRSSQTDGRWAALLAAGLFALLHGRDGIPQAGQRDLVMAVLLLAGYACSFHAVRRERPWLMVAAGLCAAIASSIKPTVLPAAFAVFIFALWYVRRDRSVLLRHAAAIVFGSLLPVAGIVFFLHREDAVSACVEAMRTLLPYHASLQRRPVGYLLNHATAPVTLLAPLWLLVLACRLACRLALRRAARKNADADTSSERSLRWERYAVYAGLLLSLLSYVLQGKGFPYQRYPFLAFFLLLSMLDFEQAAGCVAGAISGSRQKMAQAVRAIGVAGLLCSALVFAPVSAWKLSRYDARYDEDFQMMSADLSRLGGAALSGHVQCVDAFAGCIGTLYRMGLVQSTGFVVDFYLLTLDRAPVIDAMRRNFWEQMEQNPPRVFVVTKMIFPIQPSTPDSYDKLKWWPQFDAYLEEHYVLRVERTPMQSVLWSSHLERPAGYRIYVRKDE